MHEIGIAFLFIPLDKITSQVLHYIWTKFKRESQSFKIYLYF